MRAKLSVGVSLLLMAVYAKAFHVSTPTNHSEIVMVKLGIANQQISPEWRSALTSRMSKARLDSVSKLKRPLTSEEEGWIKLIESKTSRWNSFKDSLEVPFKNVHVGDTVWIMLGFTGVDDGFTYQLNTVCFDLTALQSNYGDATQLENDERIDRLFAHEYTHLIHKVWARQNNLMVRNFKDSILWECLYEGIGMYRSLSPKWFPVKGELPLTTTNTLKELSSVFVDRLSMLNFKNYFSSEERTRIHSNLSRGPINKKWGAFTVAVWLMLESRGDDRKLIPWIEKGPDAILLLAEKYLGGEGKAKFYREVLHR